MEEEVKTILGYCEVSGEPIYNGDSYIEDHGKLYTPEHYAEREVKKKSLLDKILRR